VRIGEEKKGAQEKKGLLLLRKGKDVRPACSLMALRSANQGLAAVAEEAKRMPLAALAILEAIL